MVTLRAYRDSDFKTAEVTGLVLKEPLETPLKEPL